MDIKNLTNQLLPEHYRKMFVDDAGKLENEYGLTPAFAAEMAFKFVLYVYMQNNHPGILKEFERTAAAHFN